MDMKSSLYKLADALQVPLEYLAGKVSGGADGVYSGVPELNLPFTVTAKKMFVHETIGVLVHVMGDLSLVVSHFGATGVVTALLLDGNKLMLDGVKSPPELFFSKTSSGRDVVDSMRHAIVASFMWQNRKWSPLKLPA